LPRILRFTRVFPDASQVELDVAHRAERPTEILGWCATHTSEEHDMTPRAEHHPEESPSAGEPDGTAASAPSPLLSLLAAGIRVPRVASAFVVAVLGFLLVLSPR